MHKPSDGLKTTEHNKIFRLIIRERGERGTERERETERQREREREMERERERKILPWFCILREK